jgi:hypothetical protein
MENNMKVTNTNIDAITGEVTITERDLTVEEIKARKEHEKKMQEMQAEAEAKASAKAAILDRIGLTADELKLILG